MRMRRFSTTALAAGAAILAGATSVGPAGAASAGATAQRALGAATTRSAGPVVVADGLNNPRQLSFAPNGDLYIAEAGTGGVGPCLDGDEGEVCYGRTGSVTRIRGGVATRVLTRLPSLAGAGGFGASGPSDIAVRRNGTYLLTLGLGSDPATRATLPGPARQLGTVLVGTLPAAGGVGGDLAAHEAADDPDGQGIDSNPTSVEIVGGKNYVIDAGANALLRQSGSAISTVSVFENRMVPKPPFLPPPGLMPMQSVPTTVVGGPDGALYVSELTGFPFPAGEARIWRVVPGSAPTVYASGLTNVTGLAFAGRTLYAVEFSSAGLLTVPEGEVPTGSLLRITPGASRHTVIAGGLTAPYGVAIRGGSAYVTTCGLCAWIGGVVKIGR